MIRSTASKVMWVGRATVFLVGLAVILAVVVGLASTALAHTGVDKKLFHLGHNNPVAALSKLTGSVANGVLQVTNTSTANTTQDATAIGATNNSVSSPAMRATNAGRGTALELNVTCPISSTCFKAAPMKVNSDTKVDNLNSDKLDGQDSSEFAPAYKRTVVVSPTGTNTQNGTALLNALSGITDASATKPYLLYIEAGTYDLGSGSLAMKEHVDIQGAGELKTLITSTESNCPSGTVRGANNAELRFLTARNTGASGCSAAIFNDNASPRLTQVTAESIGGGGSAHIGVYNYYSSNPTMINVTATASGGSSNYGVSNYGSSATIRHSRLSGTTYSLDHRNGTAKVALTQLVGPVYKGSSATLQCFDNYNDSLAAVTCP